MTQLRTDYTPRHQKALRGVVLGVTSCVPPRPPRPNQAYTARPHWPRPLNKLSDWSAAPRPAVYLPRLSNPRVSFSARMCHDYGVIRGF
ncbi:hypothetical protein E2C01_002127 [Portunus trituberculatus]|uniref:Uncharacterized protein n=1 Tax=Portunus trituberculatus TaxID=210409 RepID=A0A5B7CIJ6_PORTR|nr:hypothetical protein [Portunus trituberculatus]